MVIQELGLVSFRNYDELFIKFSRGVNLFVGKNGQGKTNLLEALYLVTHLASFRTRRLEPLIAFGKPDAFVQAIILKDHITHKTRIELARQGKKVWLNNVTVARSSSYISAFFSLLFNADNLYTLRHVPSERRGFLDRYLSFLDPAYFTALKDMRVVLAEKNRLLKSGDLRTLEEWNHLLIQKGYVILQKREAFAKAIKGELGDVLLRISGRQDGLTLAYRPSLGGSPEEWAAALSRAAERERNQGHALLGPHRDEFRLVMGGARSEEALSQGEYRIAVLALLLAMERHMREAHAFTPVLVLDDLFSELDLTVQEAVMGYLAALPNQIFITAVGGAEGLRFGKAKAREIVAGRVV